MSEAHRKPLKRFHEPGDIHELTFSVYQRQKLHWWPRIAPMVNLVMTFGSQLDVLPEWPPSPRPVADQHWPGRQWHPKEAPIAIATPPLRLWPSAALRSLLSVALSSAWVTLSLIAVTTNRKNPDCHLTAEVFS
jgi:hypothetical protein